MSGAFQLFGEWPTLPQVFREYMNTRAWFSNKQSLWSMTKPAGGFAVPVKVAQMSGAFQLIGEWPTTTSGA
jgi:hypothetical protein